MLSVFRDLGMKISFQLKYLILIYPSLAYTIQHIYPKTNSIYCALRAQYPSLYLLYGILIHQVLLWLLNGTKRD